MNEENKYAGFYWNELIFALCVSLILSSTIKIITVKIV